MTPLPFVRALFCVDGRYRRLRGSAATSLGCPSGGAASSFLAAHPGLFSATGFAHHPYNFFHPPSSSATDPNFVPLANLGRLELVLDHAFAAYGVARRIPIYLTEYGYQTNPPDPFQVFGPRRQAAFLNEADYMAWRDARVRSVAQFLLYDSLPDSRYPPADFSYWDTFQTGLRFADGRPKPAFAAYRMPIWIPVSEVRRGHSMLVWGQLRPAPRNSAEQAEIQWRAPAGPFRTIATATTRNPRAYLTARIRPPASGQIRIQWLTPTGTTLTSRAVPITVR